MRAPPDGRVRRVLLVEDDTDNAFVLGHALAHPCVELHLATNGLEGVALARKLLPDLVILDVGLPIMDGFEIFRTLRATPELAHTAWVFISGSARAGALGMARDLGAAFTIRKPFKDEVVRDRVLELLGIQQHRRKAVPPALLREAVADEEAARAAARRPPIVEAG
jgi:two-component system alkaline phosphatase synthesis response regulator PhoP